MTLPNPRTHTIQRIDGCSHSGMIGGYTGGGEQSYFKKVAKALGARKCGWLSAGGSAACWPTLNAGSDGGWSWVLNMFRPPKGANDTPITYWNNDATSSYQPHTNVAFVHHGAEDLFYLGSQNLKAYQEAIRTEMSRYCAAFLHEAESDVQIPTPFQNNPTAAGTTGTLAAGTWYSKLTAYNAIGETVGSAQVQITITAGQVITWSWPAFFGATGYRLYRNSVVNSQTMAGYIDVPGAAAYGSTVTLVDDGTVALNAGALAPPGTNTANMHWSFGSGINQTVASGSSWIYSGGGCRYMNNGQVANPATQWAQYQTDPDYPGNLVVAIGMGVIPGAVGAGTSATLGVTVDGVAQPDVVLNYDKGGHADAENGKTNGIVLRIGRADCGLGIALGAGVHTIRLSVKAMTGTTNPYVIFDYAQIEADPLDGPILVGPSGMWKLASWAGQFPVSAGWTHGSDAAVDPLNDASVDALIAAQRAVLNDFPGRSVYVDIDSLIAKNASGNMLNRDGVHPSNHGHSRIADAAEDAIVNSGLLTTRLVSAVGNRHLGAFDGGVWRTIGGVYGTGANMRPFLNTWGPYSTGSVFPSYMLGALDGRARLRGWVKQNVTPPGSFTAAAAAGTQLGIGTYRYVITFTTLTGETIGGTEVTVTTTANNQAVNLSAIPSGPTGTSGKNIYRTAVGGAAGTEKFVANISNPVATYTDTKTDAALGAAVPTGGLGAQALFQNDQGGGLASQPAGGNGAQDLVMPVNTGAGWLIGLLRIDTETANPNRQVWPVFNGQAGAGSLMELNGISWEMEL